MLDKIYQTYSSMIINLFRVEIDEELGDKVEKKSNTSSFDPRSRRVSNRLPFRLTELLEEEENNFLETEEFPENFIEHDKIFIVEDCPVLPISPPHVWKCLNTHPVIRIWFMSRIMANMSKFLFEIRDKKVGGYYAEKFIKPTVDKLNWLKEKMLDDISTSIVEGKIQALLLRLRIKGNIYL